MWRSLMKRVAEQPNLKRISNDRTLIGQLEEANKRLENIQKGLVHYLETKRLAFPRFFFLSNEELLEILSQVRDPLAVQPHLRKCFENITELKFEGREITAMVSNEGEAVDFIQVIDPITYNLFLSP